MLLRLFILAFILTGFPQVTMGAPACNELFQDSVKPDLLSDRSFEQLFPGLERQYPRLAKIATGRVLRRIQERNHEDWKQLEDIFSSCSSAACSIELSAKDFSFGGRVQIVDGAERKPVLQIFIDYFRASRDSTGKDKSYLAYGSRPSGLNFQFINLVGTIFSAIYRVIDSHPEVQTVRIIGSKVVNKALAVALEDIGFQATNEYHEQRNLARFIKAFSMGYANATLFTILQQESVPFILGVKAVGKVGGALYESRTYTPRDWVLELPIGGN